MPAPGDRIGPYVVTREIGRGGMGVVYLADDPRLGRAVAIKALPDDVAADSERLDRFEREARALAALNHPNIAGILGVETVDGAKFLVLEYVEGETLGDRLERGPIPVAEALEIAIQVANGLEAAHDAGVVHRDLKPDNVRITPTDDVKILDFGLAKVGGSGSSSPSASEATLTSPRHATQPGAILGTAAYMSPEQARGRAVDRRSDIWSFGVLLYECLTSIGPFHGETATDSIGAILHKEVDLGLLPPNTPPLVRHVLLRCLERDRRRRLQSIGDARIELETALADPDAGVAGPDGAVGPSRGRAVSVLIALPLVAAALGLGLVVGRTATPPAADPVPIHAALPVTIADHISSPDTHSFAIAPDGRSIAFIGSAPDRDGPRPTSIVFLRSLDEADARTLPGSENAQSVSFSPDGSQIGFTWWDPDSRREEFRRMSVDGGPPITVFTDIDGDEWNMADAPVWLDDASMLARSQDNRALFRVPIDGRPSEPLGELDNEDGRWLGTFDFVPLPDGRQALCTRVEIDARGLHAAVCRVDLQTGASTIVLPDAGAARRLDDVLLFTRDETLCAVVVDPATCTPQGAPVPLIPGLGGGTPYAVSTRGDLVYARGDGEDAPRRVVAIDRSGIREVLSPTSRQYVGAINPSPDGESLGTTIIESERPRSAVLSLATGFIRPLGDAGQVTLEACYHPDGSLTYIAFHAPSDLAIMVIEDAGDPIGRVLLHDPQAGNPDGSVHLTADGRWAVLLYEPADDRPDGIYLLDRADGGAPRPFIATEARERDPILSPDGRWLAFTTDASGVRQVTVARFEPDGPAPLRFHPVSYEGGDSPFWSSDGSSLLFIDEEGDLMEAAFTAPEHDGTVPRIDMPRRVHVAADLDLFRSWSSPAMAALPDGQRFIYYERTEDEQPLTHLDLCLNWRIELERRLPRR